MKLLTTITAAVLVMAVTGCETAKPLSHFSSTAEYAAQFAIDPKLPYFGDGTTSKGSPLLEESKGKTLPSNVSLNVAAAPAMPMGGGAAPPVIVNGQGWPGMTTVTPMPNGGTRVVNYGLPVYRPPVAPYPYYGY